MNKAYTGRKTKKISEIEDIQLSNKEWVFLHNVRDNRN